MSILQSLRRSHIRVEYSISWLAAAVILFTLSRWGATLNWLGNLIGVDYPPLVLSIVLTLLLVVVLYRISMIVSNLRDNNIALAQKVAILEYQLRALQDVRESKT
jgi:hypothetical protein